MIYRMVFSMGSERTAKRLIFLVGLCCFWGGYGIRRDFDHDSQTLGFPILRVELYEDTAYFSFLLCDPRPLNRCSIICEQGGEALCGLPSEGIEARRGEMSLLDDISRARMHIINPDPGQ